MLLNTPFVSGILNLGSTTDTKITCIFDRNLKHGPGIVVGNSGRVIKRNPLFLHDKPVPLCSEECDCPESFEEENSDTELSSTKIWGSNGVHLSSQDLTPRSFRLKFNKIEVIAHMSPQDIDISDYVKRVIEKYGDRLTNNTSRTSL